MTLNTSTFRAPTINEAIAYARAFFAHHDQPITIAGSIKTPDADADFARDVLFDLDGHRYKMTCWLEANRLGQVSVFGEW